MNEWRANPFGDPVVVAESRHARPHAAGGGRTTEPGSDHLPGRENDPGPLPGTDRDPTRAAAPLRPGEVAHDPACPFCTGNEGQTPPELAADRPAGAATPDTPGWLTRVVPNKYPAFAADASPGGWAGSRITLRRGAVGVHEVAIHSPDHSGRLARLSASAAERVVTTWQARLQAHRADGWTSTVLAVNEGVRAGASLAHPHAQLFATDTVPPAWSAELDRQRDWADDHGRPLLADVVTAEAGGDRHVDADGDLLAWAPYWASVPFETWIAAAAPDSPGGAFADAGGTARSALARLLGRVCRRIAVAAGDPDLNVVVRDVPHGGSRASWWHVRIVPCGPVAAGWEMASGVRIVTVAPETAAAALRSAAHDVTGPPPGP